MVLCLYPLLNEKLTNDICFNLARKFKDYVWKLDDMLIFLTTEIEAKERSISVWFSTDSLSYKNNHQSYSASSLVTHASKKACPFCNLANRSASKCLKVANPNIQKQILREKRLCYICLESGHVAKFSKGSYQCNKCNGKHNISVCTFKKKEKPQDDNDTKESIAANLNHVENGTLLQTAIAMVSNLSNTKSDNSAILFDTCSQRSFISTKLQEKLKLPIIWKESFYIKVFAKSGSTLQKCDIVSLQIFTQNNGMLILELICTPVITSFAFQHQVRHGFKKYEYLWNLKLAHTLPHEVTNKNMLIGLNHYYSLILGEMIKGKINEPIAITSVLGWIICGNYQN